MMEIFGNLLFWLMIIILIPVIVFVLFGITIIRDDAVGICIRKIFGKQMPQGQIIAREYGDVGIQADVLMPKLYWRNPITWTIQSVPITEIPPGKIGVVEAIDGKPLPHGRLLGDSIDCNSFQDAKMFLDNGGQRGPQIEILRPGSYRINTELFKIGKFDVTMINKEEIGVAIAQDGRPLPSGFIVAPKPSEESMEAKI